MDQEVKMSAPLETSRFQPVFFFFFFCPSLLEAVKVVQTEPNGVDGVVYSP